jgi:hypothetical protein
MSQYFSNIDCTKFTTNELLNKCWYNVTVILYIIIIFWRCIFINISSTDKYIIVFVIISIFPLNKSNLKKEKYNILFIFDILLSMIWFDMTHLLGILKFSETLIFILKYLNYNYKMTEIIYSYSFKMV